MRKNLGFALFVVAVLGAFVALAQRKSSDGLHLGSTATPVLIDGALTVSGSVTGITAPAASVAFATVDAGQVFVQNQLGVNGPIRADSVTLSVATVDAGQINVQNQLGLGGPIACNGTTICGSVALSSASPSTATVTVPSGVTCACWPVGGTAAIAAGGCAANVSSTTLTLTGPNTVTTTMRYLCFK